MNILARVLRFLFWFLIFVWGARVLRQFAAQILRGNSTKIPPAESAAENVVNNAADAANVMSRRLVQDPVCGMRLAEVLAIPLRENGEVLSFCSAECRNKYLSAQNKSTAASA
jgi:YHS domain-containing protein